jgi:hypothetical protein
LHGVRVRSWSRGGFLVEKVEGNVEAAKRETLGRLFTAGTLIQPSIVLGLL